MNKSMCSKMALVVGVAMGLLMLLPANADWEVVGHGIRWWHFGSDVNPGCIMSWEVDEALMDRDPNSIHYGESFVRPCDALCTVYRDDVAIAEVRTEGREMTWFTDYDVVPGSNYVYRISACGEESSPLKVGCSFVFQSEVGADEVSFGPEGGREEVSVLVQKVTADSTSFAFWSNPTSSVEWLSAEIGEGWRTVVISAGPNDTEAAREGVVVIPCPGAECRITVKQAAHGAAEFIDEKDIVAPYDVPKAATLQGALYGGDDIVGIVELKLGKVSKGKSRVSGSVTTLDGKKHTAKSVTVTGIDGTAPATVSLEVKGLGTMTVAIGGAQFAGTLDGTYHVQSASVGGEWEGGTAVAAVEPGDLSVFAGTALADFLPTNEVATVKNGKWTFAKAAGVKWAKPKNGAALPDIYDEASRKGLVVDDSKGKTNLSGLKLTYTPKKGTFKGSFNVYALEGSGSATKLKKYKISVSGVVVGGAGYGMATCKKPSLAWPITVE